MDGTRSELNRRINTPQADRLIATATGNTTCVLRAGRQHDGVSCIRQLWPDTLTDSEPPT
jgi:hypothetical protein